MRDSVETVVHPFKPNAEAIKEQLQQEKIAEVKSIKLKTLGVQNQINELLRHLDLIFEDL